MSAAHAWSVGYHPLARAEAEAIPSQDQRAVNNAADKLAALGPNLAFPHSSKIMGHKGGHLRELRPRAGRSAWRCIYCRVGDAFVILAVCREAQHDQSAYESGVRRAIDRLYEIRT